MYRFDLLQNADNLQNFILVEIYGDTNAAAAHKVMKYNLKCYLKCNLKCNLNVI